MTILAQASPTFDRREADGAQQPWDKPLPASVRQRTVDDMLSSFRRSRRAFTLIELIVVVVVLAVLASIAIVGYSRVIDRTEWASLETTAESMDRQYQALLASDPAADPEELALTVIADMPSALSQPQMAAVVLAADPLPVATYVEPGDAASGEPSIEVERYDKTVCLTLPADTGESVDGRVNRNDCATTPATTVPAGPTTTPSGPTPFVVPNFVANSGDEMVTVGWDPPTFNPAGYGCDLSRDGVVIATGITSYEYTDIGLTNGVDYSYSLSCYNGIGDFSAPVTSDARPFTSIVAAGAGTLPDIAIAASDDGAWHMFIDRTNDEVWVSADDGDTWEVTAGPTGLDLIAGDVDALGRAWVLTWDGTNGRVQRLDGGGWSDLTSSGAGQAGVVAFGNGDRVQVKSVSWSTHTVRYTTNGGGSWSGYSYGPANAAGYSNSASTVEIDGVIHMVESSSSGYLTYRRMTMNGPVSTLPSSGLFSVRSWDSELLYDPADPSHLYIVSRAASTSLGAYGGGLTLQESLDGGATWTMLSENALLPSAVGSTTMATLGSDDHLRFYGFSASGGVGELRVVSHDPDSDFWSRTTTQISFPVDTVRFATTVWESQAQNAVSVWLGSESGGQWEIRHVRGGQVGFAVDATVTETLTADANGRMFDATQSYGGPGAMSPDGTWMVTAVPTPAAFMRSQDGITWTNVGVPPPGSANSPNGVTIDNDGNIYAEYSSGGTYPTAVSYQYRDGRWWGPVTHSYTSQVNVGGTSGIAQLTNGKMVALHPSTRPVQVSSDNGETWQYTVGNSPAMTNFYPIGERVFTIRSTVGYAGLTTTSYGMVDTAAMTAGAMALPALPWDAYIRDFVTIFPRPGSTTELYMVFVAETGEMVIWQSLDAGTTWADYDTATRPGSISVPVAAGIGDDDKMWFMYNSTVAGTTTLETYRRGFLVGSPWTTGESRTIPAGHTWSPANAGYGLGPRALYGANGTPTDKLRHYYMIRNTATGVYSHMMWIEQ